MLKRFAVAVAATAVMSVAGSANAAPVYSCPAGSAECLGQTFAFWIESSSGAVPSVDYVVAFSIDTTGYTGPGGALATDIEFSFGSGTLDLTGLTMLSAPGGTGIWTPSNQTLAGNGCQNPTNGKNVCVAGASGQYAFTVGDVLTWKIGFQADELLPSLAHIKYLYENANGQKIAGLLSKDIAVQNCAPSTQPGGGLSCDPPVTAPEPASILLLGSGLLFAANRLRRKA